MVVESLNDRIKKKFWELQDEQAAKKPSAQRSLIWVDSADSAADYYKDSLLSWDAFNEEIKKEIDESTAEVRLFVNKGGAAVINCNGWSFPYKVEVGGVANKISFVSSVFKKGISVTKSDVVRMLNFYDAEFRGEVSFNGNLGESNFVSTKFVDCQSVYFSEVDFNSDAMFQRCYFKNSEPIFQGSNFFKSANFRHLTISGRAFFKFVQCNFYSSFDFYIWTSSEGEALIEEIDLTGSEFFKSVLFHQVTLRGLESVKIANVFLSGTIFREPFVLKFSDLKICPDFSETYLLDVKKLSLNEGAWRVDERKIESSDEPKFRFLKKYFAEQGNHFKEREYFSYEMRAREKKLSLEGGADLFLFKCYKWLSEFGMSVSLPFAWMWFSFALFFNLFLLFDCDPIVALTNSFARTVNPLMSFDIFKKPIGNGLITVLVFQTIINTSLIFLLGLGIRNKFKIK
jgi:hypothetical protein